MAVVFYGLGSGGLTNNLTGYPTGVHAPSSNHLNLAAILNTGDDGVAPTIIGNGLTWVQITTFVYDVTKRVTLFRSLSGGLPAAGTAFIDFSGNTQAGCSWVFAGVRGVDQSGGDGSGAVVQAASNGASASTALTITLNSFASTDNGALAAFALDDDVAVAPKSGWAELAEILLNDGADSATNEVQWIDSNDTTPTATAATAEEWGGIAVEIAASGGGVVTAGADETASTYCMVA